MPLQHLLLKPLRLQPKAAPPPRRPQLPTQEPVGDWKPVFVVLFTELGTPGRSWPELLDLKASCVQVKQTCVNRNVEALIRAWRVCTGRRWTVLHYISNGLRMVLLLLLGDERQCSCSSAGDTCHGEAAGVSCSAWFWFLSGSVLLLIPFLAFHHGVVGITPPFFLLLFVHTHVHCCVVTPCFSYHSPFLLPLRPLCTLRKQHRCNSSFRSRPFGLNSGGEK